MADPQLFQSQGFGPLPPYEMAGIRSGTDLDQSPYLQWIPKKRELVLFSHYTETVSSDFAKPSLLGVDAVK
jgi:hypothetical protein